MSVCRAERPVVRFHSAQVWISYRIKTNALVAARVARLGVERLAVERLAVERLAVARPVVVAHRVLIAHISHENQPSLQGGGFFVCKT